MAAYIGKVRYVVEEDMFADATDVEDAEFKMKEAFKDDMPDAVSYEIFDIEEIKK